MKKLSLILSAGVMVMASCSSEDVVNPAAGNDNAGEAPIGFSIYTPNMSRAGLETLNYDFGVFAYKGADQASQVPSETNLSLVMENYLVGYTDGTVGYVPEGGQNLYGTTWYYEGLGNEDTGKFNFVAGTQTAASTALKEHQYLKYWDRGTTNTYFYAYTPYSASTTISVAADKTSLTFPGMEMDMDVMSTSPGADYMFAVAKCNNVDMYTNAKKVNLEFQHLGAKLRLGFYESIPGWDVELIDFTTNDDATIPQEVIVLVPTKADIAWDGANYSYSNYAAGGEYYVKATPTVNFVDGVYNGVSYDYTGATSKSSANFYCPIWFQDKNKTGEHTRVLTESATNPLVGDFKCVIPANSGTYDSGKWNCGFTVNVSFKLTATDTNEVIYVRGARVYVPAEYCQWEANKAYTYIFHITDLLPGKPGQPDPGVGPDPNPALLPIVFDAITIATPEDVEYTIHVNHNPE